MGADTTIAEILPWVFGTVIPAIFGVISLLYHQALKTERARLKDHIKLVDYERTEKESFRTALDNISRETKETIDSLVAFTENLPIIVVNDGEKTRADLKNCTTKLTGLIQTHGYSRND